MRMVSIESQSQFRLSNKSTNVISGHFFQMPWRLLAEELNSEFQTDYDE